MTACWRARDTGRRLRKPSVVVHVNATGRFIRRFERRIAAAVLACLIFFLPSGSFADGAPQSPRDVVLLVDTNGAYLLDGKVVDEGELAMQLSAIATSGEVLEFHLRSENDIPSRQVLRALEIAREAGMPLKVGYIHQPPSESDDAETPERTRPGGTVQPR